MGIEIERKFLVHAEAWQAFKQQQGITGKLIRQGYLSDKPEATVRVRTKGDSGWLTIKGATQNVSRLEYEYEISLQDVNHMLDTLCLKPLVEKYRFVYEEAGVIWEVDEFLGVNQGLLIAEIELPDEKAAFAKPGWLGEEVSHDGRYFNASLVKHPYCDW